MQTKHMKLTQEEREELALLVDSSGGWEAVKNVLNHLVVELERRVLTYPLREGPQELVHAKARAEGGAHLARELIYAVEAIAAKERKAR